MEDWLSMPIPSRAEIYEATKGISIDDQDKLKEIINKLYEDKGWVKVLQFNWVEYNPSMQLPVLTTYEVDAESLGCSCDAKGKANYVSKEKTGIFRTCGACRCTSGAIDRDRDMKQIDSKFVTIEKALDIIEKENIMPCPALKDLMRGKNNPIKVYW